ncbi:MAG TPA: hypothetical protein DIS73_02955 [Planctomycetia bacterium]|nr:hypothetical protein [Planctomycetia bacterium]
MEPSRVETKPSRMSFRWKLAWILVPAVTFAFGMGIGLEEGFNTYSYLKLGVEARIFLIGLQYAFLASAFSALVLAILFFTIGKGGKGGGVNHVSYSSRSKNVWVSGISGLVFLTGVFTWIWLRDHSGFSFGFVEGVMLAGLIGGITGAVMSLVKSKHSTDAILVTAGKHSRKFDVSTGNSNVGKATGSLDGNKGAVIEEEATLPQGTIIKCPLCDKPISVLHCEKSGHVQCPHSNCHARLFYDVKTRTLHVA